MHRWTGYLISSTAIHLLLLQVQADLWHLCIQTFIMLVILKGCCFLISELFQDHLPAGEDGWLAGWLDRGIDDSTGLLPTPLYSTITKQSNSMRCIALWHVIAQNRGRDSSSC